MKGYAWGRPPGVLPGQAQPEGDRPAGQNERHRQWRDTQLLEGQPGGNRQRDTEGRKQGRAVYLTQRHGCQRRVVAGQPGQRLRFGRAGQQRGVDTDG